MTPRHSNSRFRPGRVAVGIAMLIISFLMATGVDEGVTRGWTDPARTAWVLSMMALLIGGLLTLFVGVGILSREGLASVGTAGRSPSVGQFIAAYVGFLVIGLIPAIYLNEKYGIDGRFTIFVSGGALFLLAATGWPWWFYGTIRRLGWFALISNDRTMRLTLALLGLALVIVGLVGATGGK